MKYALLLTLILTVILTTYAEDQPTARVAGDPPSWDSYQSIVNQNIFVRSRTKPKLSNVVDEQRDRIDVPSAPQLILRGIVQRGETFIAFIENNRTGKIITAHCGDEFDGYQVEKISLTNLQFTAENQTFTIDIGQKFATHSQSSAMDSYFEATIPDDDSNDSSEQLSVIERLRQKRQAQLGKDSNDE